MKISIILAVFEIILASYFVMGLPVNQTERLQMYQKTKEFYETLRDELRDSVRDVDQAIRYLREMDVKNNDLMGTVGKEIVKLSKGLFTESSDVFEDSQGGYDYDEETTGITPPIMIWK